MRPTLTLMLLCTLAAGPTLAAEERIVPASDRKAIGVTIYNHDLALVKDRRTIDLEPGAHTLAFREVSARIRPETVLVRADGLRVHEQNFEYDLLSPQALLRKYVGREVTLIDRHPTTGEEKARQVRVLSAGDGVVLQAGDRIETEISGRLVYPDVPANLRDRPTLTMAVDNDRAGQQEVEVSYLTGGLSWRADYVAELNDDDSRLDLNGWVTLTNESGVSYPDARLQLVAGDVHRVEEDYGLRGAVLGKMAVAAAAPEMREESLFEYHLYTLARPTTIADNQKKQVALLQAGNVACRKEYLLEGQGAGFRAQAGDGGHRVPVTVWVEVRNDQASGLGLPVPAGVARVYKKDAGGRLQFVGEDRLAHTPENEVIRLRLGDAFDVTAERRQTDFRWLDDGGDPVEQRASAPSSGQPAAVHLTDTDRKPKRSESAWAITLKNARPEAVTVRVRETLPGEWQILEESAAHTKASAHAAVWQVSVPAKGSAELTYRVRVRH